MTWFGYSCETDGTQSRRDLEAELLPFERQDKPGWEEVPATEKDLRRARVAVVRRLISSGQNAGPARGVIHA